MAQTFEEFHTKQLETVCIDLYKEVGYTPIDFNPIYKHFNKLIKKISKTPLTVYNKIPIRSTRISESVHYENIQRISEICKKSSDEFEKIIKEFPETTTGKIISYYIQDEKSYDISIIINIEINNFPQGNDNSQSILYPTIICYNQDWNQENITLKYNDNGDILFDKHCGLFPEIIIKKDKITKLKEPIEIELMLYTDEEQIQHDPEGY